MNVFGPLLGRLGRLAKIWQRLAQFDLSQNGETTLDDAKLTLQSCYATAEQANVEYNNG